ncbi:MAG: sulfatase [Holophagae bacterium]
MMTWIELRSIATAAVWVALAPTLGTLACRAGNGGSAIDELLALDARGRDVVVVLSDTHRLDHVTGFAAPPDDPTPNVARLMRDAVAFEAALTPVPISAPAYATLMTGMAPLDHGLLNNEQPLPVGPVLLQEQLHDAGYRTSAVVGNPYCSAGHGFARGFDAFWDRIDGVGNRGEVITDQAVRWLDTVADDRPIFLFLAYMDAHTPYITDTIPPSLRVEVNGVHLLDARAENAHVEQRYELTLQPGRNIVRLLFLEDGAPASPDTAASPLHVRGMHLASGRPVERTDGVDPVPGTGFSRLANRSELEIVNRGSEPVTDELVFRCYRKYRHENIPRYYRAGVASFDRSFGRLVAALKERGRYDDAVVVFLSDHGEMLGEHDAWGHVEHVFQESLQVPLVIKAPGLPGGRHDATRIGLRDVHDLILEVALGTDPERRRAIAERRRLPFVAATYPPEGSSLQVAALSDGFKVVVDADAAEHAYDLGADPGERVDLLAAGPGGAAVDRLLTIARSELAAAASAKWLDIEVLSPAERDRLRALGYLDATP